MYLFMLMYLLMYLLMHVWELCDIMYSSILCERWGQLQAKKTREFIRRVQHSFTTPLSPEIFTEISDIQPRVCYIQ